MLLGSLGTQILSWDSAVRRERIKASFPPSISPSLPPSFTPSLPFSFFLQEFIEHLLCAKLADIPVEKTYQGVLCLAVETANNYNIE